MGDRAWVQRYFTAKKFFQLWLNDYTHNEYDLNMIVIEHFVRNRRKV